MCKTKLELQYETSISCSVCNHDQVDSMQRNRKCYHEVFKSKLASKHKCLTDLLLWYWRKYLFFDTMT